MVAFHIFVIIGVTLAGFCGHGSWGHGSDDYSPFRSQRNTHGFEIASFEGRRRPDYLSAKSTTARPVTDDDIPQNHLTNILKVHEIIGDIIDTAPYVVLLEVAYDGGVVVNNGDELTVDETVNKPKSINWESADENSYYTLLLVDPDAPNRLKADDRSWQHWIVGNILGRDLSTGTVLTEYNGPAPPPGSGFHRYVFLLFEQPDGEIVFGEPYISKTNPKRSKFSVREFIARHHFGPPAAVNFFQAKRS